MEKKFSERNVALRREVETRFLPIDRRYPRTRYRSSRTFYIAQPWPVSHWTVVAPFSARGDPFAAIRYRSDTRCISAATTFLLPLLARWKRMAVCGRVGRRGPVEWLKTISRPDAAMGTGSEKMIRNEVARDGIHPLLYICADERFRNDPLGACR